MRTRVEDYKTIAQSLKSNYPDLTEYERLSLAVQIERNQIFENGLNLSREDQRPSALEAIGIVLGYDSGIENTILKTLKDISDKD